MTVAWTRNERSPVAGLKTTSYAENVVALRHARARGATEALLANTRGELCEGTGSNVAVVLPDRPGELLTPPLPGMRTELSRHVLAPGARTGEQGDPPMHEPGAREVSLVERGELRLVIDGDHHRLAEGDCVTFDADLAHRFENHGDETAELLAVVAAGLRRS